MQIFQKPDRKTVMHGSNHQNSRLSTSEKYSQMIQRQLEDDFKVRQYLNENPSDTQNSIMYIALLNTMQQRKKGKKKMKMSLMNTKASNDLPLKYQIEEEKHDEKNIFISQISMTQSVVIGIKEKHNIEEEKILNRFAQETKINQNLLAEIEQNKKSLVHFHLFQILMKGDIKRMIDRHKSIQILEIKINKESIISNNQLKRVSMALMKDREQVSLLQDMQNKFGERLKSVGKSEAKNVIKTRANFVQLMNKRKAIFERLIESQKECASIQEFSDKVKQKNQKNRKSINCFLLLQFLSHKITQFTKLQIQFKEKSIDAKSYCQSIKQQLNSHTYESHHMEPQILNQQLQQRLNGFLTNILGEYSRLERQIEEKNKIFRDTMGSIKQNQTITNGQHLKVQQINYHITQQKQKQQLKSKFNPSLYIQKTKSLEAKIKIICILINFMDKRIPSFTGTRFVNQLFYNLDWYYKIHADEQQEISKDFDQELFNKIKFSLKFWFTQLHNFILESQAKRVIKPKTQIFAESFDYSNQKNKTWSRPEDCSPQKTRRHGKLKTATTFEMDQKQIQKALEKDDDESYENHEINRFSSCVTTQKNGNSPKKSENSQNKDKVTRVELLEKIDHSYYKMIKQTLKMEKQNTRKNYKFEKTFKRDKYSSQDELMQEKRFQSTFSSTFKHEHDQQRMFKISSEFKSRKTIKQSLHLRNSFSNSCISIKNEKTFSQKRLKRATKHSTIWQKQKKAKMKQKLRMIFQQTLNF